MRFAEKIVTLRDGRTALLRSPGPADAAEMLDYLRLTSGETHNMIRFPEEITMTVPEEAEHLVKTLCAERSLMIAAFVNGVLAGNAGLNPLLERKKTAHRAEFGIAVKKAYWGLGIGGILLEALAQEAPAMGYEQLELDVFADNRRAIRLYERHGFTPCGREPRAFRLGEGAYVDDILMVRFLP